MSKNTSFSIGKRLALGFGAVLVLMLGLTVFGVAEVRSIDQALTSITDVNAVKQRYAINFRGSVHDRAISLRDVVLVSRPSELDEALSDIKRLEAFYAESAVALDNMFATRDDTTPQERELLGKIKRIESDTQAIVKRVIDARLSGNLETAHALLLAEARPAFTNWLATVNQFIDLQEAANQLETTAARTTAGRFSMLMVLLSGLAVLLGTCIACYITRQLTRSLGGEPDDAAHIVTRIANGDLASGIAASHPGSMLAAVSAMQGKLRAVFSDVVTAAAELSEKANGVGTVSSKAQTDAVRQAESSRASAASIERITQSMREVADIAQQTESNSEKTSELSRSGALLVETAAREMERVARTVQESSQQINGLEQRSREIGGIAQVIKEIAEQTNLLALNAAIEAARAGETGRGFAVVADEVRKLAERTAAATIEISEGIKLIQEDTRNAVAAMEKTGPQVAQGLSLTTEATALLGEINRQAADSLNNVRQVARAAEQQVSSAAQLSAHVNEIANMSTTTSESMLESVGAAKNLEQMSRRLREAVGHFRLA
jgi:methyl-accepting chemotaxis protein